jgi:hypothetical protein
MQSLLEQVGADAVVGEHVLRAGVPLTAAPEADMSVRTPAGRRRPHTDGRNAGRGAGRGKAAFVQGSLEPFWT